MEIVTDAGAVFETGHRSCSAMGHHRHAWPFATIVLSGGYVEVSDSVPEFCRGGTIVVHDVDEEHADHFSNDTRCLNVQLPRAPSLRGSLTLDDAELRAAVKSVVESFYSRCGGLTAAVKRLQSALLQQSLEPQRERPDWLQRVLDDFPWAESVPLHAAATSAGVHATHFSREFRRYLGITANEFRARARVRLASKLLLTTSSPIARIALRAGLSDQSHLTRLFSERLGLSPGAYRRTFAR
jgi:AraC-like DNA-binding protein